MSALFAAGLLASVALCGSARADWKETIDQLYPECRHMLIAQMTRAQLEDCELYERMFRGMDDAIAAQRREQGLPAVEECFTADRRTPTHLKGCLYGP